MIVLRLSQSARPGSSSTVSTTVAAPRMQRVHRRAAAVLTENLHRVQEDDLELEWAQLARQVAPAGLRPLPPAPSDDDNVVMVLTRRDIARAAAFIDGVVTEAVDTAFSTKQDPHVVLQQLLQRFTAPPTVPEVLTSLAPPEAPAAAAAVDALPEAPAAAAATTAGAPQPGAAAAAAAGNDARPTSHMGAILTPVAGKHDAVPFLQPLRVPRLPSASSSTSTQQPLGGLSGRVLLASHPLLWGPQESADELGSDDDDEGDAEPLEKAAVQQHAAVTPATCRSKAVQCDGVAGAARAVTFRVHCPTAFGQRLWLVGDHASLGGWDTARWVKMRWSEGNVWAATVELQAPAGATISYKAVLEHADGRQQWSGGANWTVALGSGRAQQVQQQTFCGGS